ncbi:bactofilin family protein [Peptoclostridium litorale]|uniref:polymer-forming cytoskeletal protein n=1 Tax=Peptoclostridium litorale TaxID=1557 RepID=UPI0012694AD4|nr:polymer-forming cytoskeletal protein [Peptoclostridium litorale]
MDRDAFLSGELAQNLGIVNGDLFMAGNSLSNQGNVTGDILMAGNTCNVSGNVDGDIRVAGNVLTIDANVKKNASLAGNSITIGSGGSVEGSVSAAASSIIINGKIGRDLRGGAGSIAINGEIGRDVEIESGSVTFGPNAKVGGNLTYTAESKIQIPEGVVAGEVVFKKAKQPVKPPKADDIKKGIGPFSIAGKLFGLVSYFVVGALAVYLFKKPFTTASDTISQKPWASLGIGFVGIVVIPVALILVMITVIGIPLAMIVWALYFIALYIARLPVALWLGNKILKSDERTIIQMLLGLLILGLLALIPYAGGWISFVVTLFGLGSIMIWLNKNIGKQKEPVEFEPGNDLE